VTSETDVNLVVDIEKFVHMGFSVMRTDIARKMGGYFDRFKCLRGEDTYLSLKFLFNNKITIIPEPYGLYHTEASELVGCGFDTIPPLSAYLADPEDLVDSCPTEKRHILKGYFSLKALEQTVIYSLLGQGKKASELLHCYCSLDCRYPKQLALARLLIMAAPVLPSVRRIWHSSKAIGRRIKKISIVLKRCIN